MPTNPIPAVPISTARYYPRLSEIITVDDLPEFLSFVQDGLNSIFDKIHYKNLQYSKGYRGDSAFYSLDIVTSQKLAIPLPFDLSLVLNPDLKNGDSAISSFPITLEYQWEILAFLKTFSSSNFSFSVENFYAVGLQVFRISEEQVIAHMLNIFVEAKDGKTKYEQLLSDINQCPEIAQDQTFQELKFPSDAQQSIESVVNLIAGNSKITKSISLLLFAVYILKSDDLSETKQKLQEFYNIIAPDGIEAHIKRIITPKAKATLELSAGIEFPQNILRPINQNGSAYKDSNAKSIFVFAQAQLYADTEAGIGYQLEMGGSLRPSPYAAIGNTGLILELDTLKVDLSKKTNIPEADADGRPNDFIGVYARAVSVTLPSKWFHEDKVTAGNIAPTLKIGAHDLLIGTGGLSGNIFLETVPMVTGGAFNYFNDKFDFLYPVTMFEKGNTDNAVKEKEIENYNDLIAYLRQLNALGLPYAFKYPLTLQTKAAVTASISPNTIYTFNSAQEYYLFLSTLIENTLWKTIGSADKGFRVGFNKFDITFKQNKVTASNIKGILELNKFKNKEDNSKSFTTQIEGHLYEDGDFNLTASFLKGNEPEASLFNFVDFKFNSLELGKENDDYYLGTSCEISFPNGIMKKFMGDQKIILEKLRIYGDGNIELEGGSIPLPISLCLDLGPVKMSVSNINFGAVQINNRKYNFWGFDGAISINPLGLDARGEGVKYYYSTDDGKPDSFLRIQTIEVDLIIPGNDSKSALAIIHGMLSLPLPGESQEFVGEVSLKLPKAKISGGVAMRFMPKHPAFLVDAHIELPVPIPLGFISLSAFRGLLGFRYVATKQAAGLTSDNSWYEYYKHPKRGINIGKFNGPPGSLKYKDPFSIGAGATFGTTADGGHVLSLRAMMLLSLPTLFYIEAGLNIIGGRLGLIEEDQSNPPFFAMVAFGDDSLELAAGADFSIPKDGGQIFELHALLEAGFFFKNQKPWYVNMGTQKDPIMARVLTLFTAKSFIMLSAQGIAAGARLDFKLQQSFGPAKVKLWAYLELGGNISFKRPQMGGYITAGGGIQIKIWIINVEIVLDTIFSVESFKPFLIYAKIDLKVRVKIGFVRVSKSFKIELQWDINRTIDYTPYSPLPKGTYGNKGDNRTLELVKGVHMLTNQAFPLNYFDKIPKVSDITNIIPLDTFIDIKTDKGLNLNTELSQKIGGFTSAPQNYTDLMPPVSESTPGGRTLRQVRHEYSIKSIELKSWSANSWEDYHPFEAIVAKKDRTEVLKKLPWAYWQKAIDQYDSIRVLGVNPFSFLSAGESGWHVPEQYGITPSKLFCVSEKFKKESTNFLNKNIGQRFYIPTQYEAGKINGLYFKLIGNGAVLDLDTNTTEGGDFMSITGASNPLGYNRSLSFNNENQLEVIFPEPAIEPSLDLTTHATEVSIKAYTAVTEEGKKFVTYKEVSLKKGENDTLSANELTYTRNELLKTITLYDSEAKPSLKTKIDKILITPKSGSCHTTTSGTPGIIDNTTFTRFYGYRGNGNYSFENIMKFGDTYLISFHPQVNTTALIQIDANGKLLRERLVNGVVTSMQVINNSLILTQALDANQCKGIGTAIINDDFVVGCQNPAATTGIIELDSDLNQNFGLLYANTYSLAYNELFPLANNEMLWINTLVNETQINWVNGSDRGIINRTSISEKAIKVLQHSSTEFSLITKDKKVIRFSINTTTKTISLTDCKVILDATVAEITDAVIAHDKTVISVKMTNGESGLVKVNENNVTLVKNSIIFNSALYLSNHTLNDHSIIAYNQQYLFLLNDALQITRLIERGSPENDATIINIQNEPSANEILMLSSKKSEKGVYFSLFDDLFDNCSLNPKETPTLTSSTAILTNFNASFTKLANATGLEYTRAPKNSSLITINDTICSKGGTTTTDGQSYELDCITYLQKIDWLSKENYIYNNNIPGTEAVEADKKAMVTGIQDTVQPIWRPNTTYYLHFTLEDMVSGKGSTTFDYYYGFKTLGPIGHYPILTKACKISTESNELLDLAKSPLSSLRQYLDYNRSYPNADGSLLKAKPSFYGNKECKVSLFFTNPYVYHMLKNWEEYDSRPEIKGALNLIIKDPLTDEIIPYPLEEKPTKYPKAEKENVEWENDNDPRIPVGIQLLNNLINAINHDDSPEDPIMKCKLNIGSPLKPKSYAYTVKLTDLKPSKLYTVLVNNHFDRNQNKTEDVGENVLVHQFGFQTSRYKNFTEQVNSYLLEEKDEEGVVLTQRPALFDIELDLKQNQIAALYDVIWGNKNSLSESMALQYQHLFDRVVEGVLKLSPLDPAQNTEFNRVIDANTGNVIALLIRNPEPFNIPKMPLAEIQNTISVVCGETNTKDDSYKALHSQDYAQVLIMFKDQKITADSLNFKFEYRTWNNNAEVVKDSVPLTLLLPDNEIVVKNINIKK